MYSPHSLYTPYQAFQGVKSRGLYTQKYGRLKNKSKISLSKLILYNQKPDILHISKIKKLAHHWF